MINTPQPPKSSLPDPLADRVTGLRKALSIAITEVPGCDPTKPREFARKLGVDKTLAWKISRMLSAESDHELLQFLPGDAAMDLFVDALQTSGGTPDSVQHVRQVISDFRESIETQIGDRSTLEIVLDSIPGQQGNRFLNSRKMVFRGNSGIYGVQARARVQTAFFLPSEIDPDLIDIALVAGWIDFRRLRRDAKWVLFRHSFHESATMGRSRTEPLDPWDQGTSGLNLLREFCSDPAPLLRSTRVGDEMFYQVYDGPLGNAGVFTCFMGSITRGAGRKLVLSPEEIGRVGAMISAPVENIQFDLFIHRDIQLRAAPSVEVVSGLTSVVNPLETDLLPLEEQIEPLRCDLHGATAVESPLLPSYSRIFSWVCKTLRLPPTDFDGHRYLVKYPPFPSTIRFCVQHQCAAETSSAPTQPPPTKLVGTT